MKKLFYVLQLRSDNINISGRESEDQTAAAAVGKGSRFAAALVSKNNFYLPRRGKKVETDEAFIYFLFCSFFFLVKMLHSWPLGGVVSPAIQQQQVKGQHMFFLLAGGKQVHFTQSVTSDSVT